MPLGVGYNSGILAAVARLRSQNRAFDAQGDEPTAIDILEEQERQQIAREGRGDQRGDQARERQRIFNANQVNAMEQQRIDTVQALSGGAMNPRSFLERRRPDVVAMDASRGTGTFESRELPEQQINPLVEEQARALQRQRNQPVGESERVAHERNLELGEQSQAASQKRTETQAAAATEQTRARTDAAAKQTEAQLQSSKDRSTKSAEQRALDREARTATAKAGLEFRKQEAETKRKNLDDAKDSFSWQVPPKAKDPDKWMAGRVRKNDTALSSIPIPKIKRSKSKPPLSAQKSIDKAETALSEWARKTQLGGVDDINNHSAYKAKLGELNKAKSELSKALKKFGKTPAAPTVTPPAVTPTPAAPAATAPAQQGDISGITDINQAREFIKTLPRGTEEERSNSRRIVEQIQSQIGGQEAPAKLDFNVAQTEQEAVAQIAEIDRYFAVNKDTVTSEDRAMLQSLLDTYGKAGYRI
jgi:hypothetical protein